MYKYHSPIGPLYLDTDGKSLTGLWMEGQKYFPNVPLQALNQKPDVPVFQETATWLDCYFSKKSLPPLPPLAPKGSVFRQAVWEELLQIPYGKITTYKALAKAIGSSPRAVGGAVGHNPISILIPCHRVLGSMYRGKGGTLTGYAGGLERKRFLLNLEQGILVKGKTSEPPSAARPAESHTPVKKPLRPGKFPCPCCGYKTFPVPKEEAVSYICPVCFWENDLFGSSEKYPSDENHGMTLSQGREMYQRVGAVQENLLPYVRKPLPEEMPE